MLKDRHFESMLDDVIPSVPAPDNISYSAWESIGDSEKLTQDLREQLPGSLPRQTHGGRIRFRSRSGPVGR